MGSTIFRGNKVVTLKDRLQVGLDESDSPSIIKLTGDPTVTAQDGVRGSIGIYPVTGQQYKKLDTGVSTAWEEIGTGASSGINYVENNDFETGVTDWVTYDNTLAGAAPDAGGTGGTATVVTRAITSVAGELLRGTTSLKIAKSAADGQGEGVSVELLPIDPADRDASKRMIVSFDYQTTANYVSGDIEVFVYDIDGTALEVVTGGSILGTNGNPSKHVCSFNTVAGNDEYRLIFHVTTTNASAYDMIIDNVTVGPDSVVPGAIITEWQTFTPSINWTNSTPTGKYRRVGDSIQVQADITLTGVPAGGVLDIDWGTPLGLTRDSAKMVKTGATKIVGVASYFDSGSNQYEGKVIDQDTVTVRVTSSRTRNATGVALDAVSTTSGDPITSWGSGDAITVDFMLPVTGWSSGASLSTTENLFKSFQTKVYNSASQNFGSGVTKMQMDSVVYDVTSAFDNANDRITVPADGRYLVQGRQVFINCGTSGLELRVYVNGSEVLRFGDSDTGTTKRVFFAEPMDLNAGDYVELFANHSDASWDGIGGELSNSFSVTAIPDFSTFSVWGETEVVNATGSTSPTVSNQFANVTSISLSPGEWDVAGSARFRSSTTAPNDITLAVSAFSANTTTDHVGSENDIFDHISATNTDTSISIPRWTVTVSSVTTIYLKSRFATVDGGTSILSGFISARRIK